MIAKTIPIACASPCAPPADVATTAPPTPAPKAVPSVNISWRAAELNPSSPGAAVSSTSSASIE